MMFVLSKSDFVNMWVKKTRKGTLEKKKKKSELDRNSQVY